MTTSPYNLLTEAWIPLVCKDGGVREVGLRTALCEASSFRGLASSHPLHVIGLYRLLLAIAHRAIGPGETDSRADLVERWPSERFEAYFRRLDDRFRLFDPDRPFLQFAELRRTVLKPRPWSLIALERSSGNAKLLFDRTLDDTPGSIEPSEAARHLVAFLQFTNGGLVKAFRTSATRGPANNLACLIAEGESLAETLALNLVPQSPSTFDLDTTPWETEPPGVAELTAGASRIPQGPAQRYAWPSRAVLLQEAGGRVATLTFAAGVDLADSPVPDPMSALIKGKESLFPVRLSETRAFWRDFHAFRPGQAGHPALTLDTAIAVRSALGRSTRTLRIVCGGLLADKAKLVLWRLESHVVPGSVLSAGAAAAAAIRPASERVEAVGRGLRSALEELCEAWLKGGSERKPDAGAVTAAASALQIEPLFWQRLEPRYWAFVATLGTTNDVDAALLDWERTVIAQARFAWSEAVSRLGARARAVAAAAQGSATLDRVLHPKFNRQQEP
jgi:CRISPR system Cascade subunit CasA